MSRLKNLYSDLYSLKDGDQQPPKEEIAGEQGYLAELEDDLNYSNSFAFDEEDDSDRNVGLGFILANFLPRGKKSKAAKLSWMVKRAGGDNPKKRVYYVTSGGHGSWKHPVWFNIQIKNKNSVKNFLKPFVAVALWVRSAGQKNIRIPLKGETKKYKYFKSKEVEDQHSHLAKIPIEIEAIQEAYQKLNLNDPRMQLEFQYFWQEIGIISNSHYRNDHYCNFYLVNPIEFLFNERAWTTDHQWVGTLENITHRRIIKNGKAVMVPYPKAYNRLKNNLLTVTTDLNFKYTVQISKGQTNSATKQISTNVTVSKTATQTEKKEVIQSNKSSFSIGDDFISLGAESGRSISNSYETSISNTRSVSESYLHARSITHQISKSVGLELSPKEKKIPPNINALTLFIKPLFRPVETKLVRFENIDAFGVAHKRVSEKKPIVVWKFDRWAIGLSYQKNISKP